MNINYFDVFDAIPNASWKGCVEARPAPHDVQDTPPTQMDSDSYFVPYFWPDEPDIDSAGNDIYPNNYMGDKENLLPLPYTFRMIGSPNPADTDGPMRFVAISKYNNTPANVIDESAPDPMCPNASCPDPILPLTDSQSDIESTIDSLSHWEGSGTVSSEGLMWGWRVLSPSEPFTEGAPYGDKKKVIILMTDGVNMAANQAGWANKTDYTAYGTLIRTLRPPPYTYSRFHEHLDERLLLACDNVKAAGLEIYTVTFGQNTSQKTTKLYENCASNPGMHYAASKSKELVGVFANIAQSLARKLALTE